MLPLIQTLNRDYNGRVLSSPLRTVSLRGNIPSNMFDFNPQGSFPPTYPPTRSVHRTLLTLCQDAPTSFVKEMPIHADIP